MGRAADRSSGVEQVRVAGRQVSGGWGAGGLGGARGLEGLAGELRMGLELGSGRLVCSRCGLWQAARLVRLAAAADPYQRQGVLWRTAPPWLRSPWSGVHPITRMSICLRTLPWIVEGSEHGYLWPETLCGARAAPRRRSSNRAAL